MSPVQGSDIEGRPAIVKRLYQCGRVDGAESPNGDETNRLLEPTEPLGVELAPRLPRQRQTIDDVIRFLAIRFDFGRRGHDIETRNRVSVGVHADDFHP